MKKLLFSLGTVAAIVAPVAAVVACGSKAEKTELTKITKGEELNAQFKAAGYSSKDADAIFAQVGGKADKAIEISKAFKGTLAGSHNEGSIAFLVKGDAKEVKTDATKGWTVDKGTSGAYFDFTVETAEPTPSSKEAASFKDTFGWNASDYNNASHLILLKVGKDGLGKTVTVFNVIKEGTKFGFTINIPDSFKDYSDSLTKEVAAKA